MRNNKGFTLIEILAVVVILGIVILISTNYVLKHVRSSRRDAFTTDVEQFIKSASYDSLVKDKMEEYVVYSFPNSGIDILPKDADAGFMIKDENEKIRIQVWHEELGLCAVKSFTDGKVYINDSIKSKEDCISFLYDIKDGEEISVKSLTNENVDYKLKSSCYTLDSDGNITNFDTNECGTVLIIPNKINGEYVNGVAADFVTNAPNIFTSLYIFGVTNIASIPNSFLSLNSSLNKAILYDLPNLTRIGTGFLSNNLNMTTFYLSNCPKLTTIDSFVGNSGSKSSLRYITLSNLPLLRDLNGAFSRSIPKKLVISDLDSLTSINNSSFNYLDGDSEIIISNNDNLQTIESSFDYSNIKKLEIYNNAKLTSITNGSFANYSPNSYYIDELIIHDNPEIIAINNGSLSGLEFKTIKLYNMLKLKQINASAFSNNITAEIVDLSGLELEVFDFYAWSGAKIDKLILPSTITSFNNGTAANLDNIVNDSIEFGGSDKCSLINLFRTSNGDGTYTYLVDKDKLPDCP